MPGLGIRAPNESPESLPSPRPSGGAKAVKSPTAPARLPHCDRLTQPKAAVAAIALARCWSATRRLLFLNQVLRQGHRIAFDGADQREECSRERGLGKNCRAVAFPPHHDKREPEGPTLPRRCGGEDSTLRSRCQLTRSTSWSSPFHYLGAGAAKVCSQSFVGLWTATPIITSSTPNTSTTLGICRRTITPMIVAAAGSSASRKAKLDRGRRDMAS